MRKRWCELWAVMALLCLGAGCGGRQTKVEAPPPPKPPADAWSWVPQSSTTIGRIGLTELRKTKLWPLWTRLQGEQQLASWVALDKIERVTFGGTGQSQNDVSYVAALEGEFAIEELPMLAERDHVAVETRGLLHVYQRPEGFWTQINDKLIVVCTADRIDELVARASAGEGVPVRASALYQSLAERVEIATAQVALLAEDPEGKARARIDQQLSRFGMTGLARDANRVGVSLEIGADYRLIGVAETADDERAQVLQDEVKKSLDSISSNLFVRMLGISALIGQLRVSSDTRYVFLRGNVSEIDFNTVIERVESALSLAAGAGSLGFQ